MAVYKKKKRTSGNKMDVVNSSKLSGHKYHAKARSGMKNDVAGASLLLADDNPKKIYAQGGVKHKAMDDPAFNTSLSKYSKEYGIPEAWVNRLIQLESGGNAAIQSKDSSATGIIQMIESTANNMGTSTAALKKMTATEQLPYAFKYWDQYKGKIKQPTDLYIANMYPKALGKPDDYKLSESAYNGNKALDKEGKGYLTVADVRKHFDPKYTAKVDEPMIMPRLNTAVADKTFTATSIPGKNELFPIQRTTLPSMGKKTPIQYDQGIRSADKGLPPAPEIADEDLMALYDQPSLASNTDFISKLFKSKN